MHWTSVGIINVQGSVWEPGEWIALWIINGYTIALLSWQTAVNLIKGKDEEWCRDVLLRGGGCNEFIDHCWGCCVLSGGKDSFIPLELVSMRAWVTSGHGWLYVTNTLMHGEFCVCN